MNKKKENEPRRFSLVKFELPNADSNESNEKIQENQFSWISFR